MTSQLLLPCTDERSLAADHWSVLSSSMLVTVASSFFMSSWAVGWCLMVLVALGGGGFGGGGAVGAGAAAGGAGVSLFLFPLGVFGVLFFFLAAHLRLHHIVDAFFGFFVGRGV